MALPTLEKTWQFNVNNVISTSNPKALMRAIKDKLLGFTTSPWVVWGSCDGNTGTGIPPGTHFGNGDGVDRWQSDTNLVWSTGNHSWMVLKQSGLNANTMLVIDLASGDPTYIGLYVSGSTGVGVANGGSDGTLTACPSHPVDLIQINPYNSMWGGTNGAVNYVLHVMQSTDGQCTRVFIFRDNQAQGLWIIDRPKNPAAHWLNPVVGGGYCANSGDIVTRDYQAHPAYYPLNTTLTGFGGTRGSMTYEATGLNAIQAQAYPDDQSFEWPLGNVGINFTTTGRRGRKGEFFDLWWGGLPNGAVYPDDGTKQFAQLGDLVVPWNGTGVRTSA